MSVRVIVICLSIYAIYLPVAMLMHRDYAPPPRPPGDVVEMVRIFHFNHEKPGQFVVRSYIFNALSFPDTSKISVYEDLTPLPRKNLRFTPGVGGYLIDLKTSDGTDPRFNGRWYWVVSSYGD